MKKVLMCRPTHYRVEYQINPWMEVGGTDKTKALAEWQALVDLYRSLGVTVEVIEQHPDFPDMVFSADQGIIFDKNKILLSHFRYIERQGETVPYAAWFEKHGYQLVRLPDSIYFEGGGECQWLGDKLLLGTGFRSSPDAAEQIRNKIQKEVIPIDLIDERFYHLDTCLLVLNKEVVFYYPPAFSTRSQHELKKLVPQLMEFTLKEVLGFVANSVVVGSHIIVQQKNKSFEKKVAKLGYTPHAIDIGQFIKAGGGAHCLTSVLE